MQTVLRHPQLTAELLSTPAVKKFRQLAAAQYEEYRRILAALSSESEPVRLTMADDRIYDKEKLIALQDALIVVEKELLAAASCLAVNKSLHQDPLFSQTAKISPNLLAEKAKLGEEDSQQNIACLLDTSLNVPDIPLSHVQQVHSILSPGRLVSDHNQHGYAFFSDLQGRENKIDQKATSKSLFVIKVDNGIDKMAHEAVIGLYVTNKLRAYLPNFMYVYSAFFCGPPALQDKNNLLQWCETSEHGVVHTLNENITDSVSLRDFVTTPGVTAEIVAVVLLQVFNALALAHLHHRFVHYDLHGGNVLVKRDVRDVQFYNPRSGAVQGIVSSEYIPYIIDYGFSCARLRCEDTELIIGNAEGMPACYNARENMPLHDCYKLICYLGIDVKRAIQLSAPQEQRRLLAIYDLLVRFYSYFGSEEDYRLRINQFLDNAQARKKDAKLHYDYFVIPPTYRSTPQNPHTWVEYMDTLHSVYVRHIISYDTMTKPPPLTLGKFVQEISQKKESDIFRYCRAVRRLTPEQSKRASFTYVSKFQNIDAPHMFALLKEARNVLGAQVDTLPPPSGKYWFLNVKLVQRLEAILRGHIVAHGYLSRFLAYVRAYECVLQRLPHQDTQEALQMMRKTLTFYVTEQLRIAKHQGVSVQELVAVYEEYRAFCFLSKEERSRQSDHLSKEDLHYIANFWRFLPSSYLRVLRINLAA